MASTSSNPDEKWCGGCKQSKPLSEFHKSKRTRDGLSFRCKPCACQSAAKWGRENRERVRRASQEYYRANMGELKAKACEWNKQNLARRRQIVRKSCRESYQKLKKQVFAAYGGPVCRCCGETEYRFLTVDHINNDGNIHRKVADVKASGVYYWLKVRGFPAGFQILCRNCNWGKHAAGGTCPHKISTPEPFVYPF